MIMERKSSFALFFLTIKKFTKNIVNKIKDMYIYSIKNKGGVLNGRIQKNVEKLFRF